MSISYKPYGQLACLWCSLDSLVDPHHILRVNCSTIKYNKLTVDLLPTWTGMILHRTRVDNHGMVSIYIWRPQQPATTTTHIHVWRPSSSRPKIATSFWHRKSNVWCKTSDDKCISFYSSLVFWRKCWLQAQSLQQVPVLQLFQTPHGWQGVFAVVRPSQDHSAEQQVLRPRIGVLQGLAGLVGKIDPCTIQTFEATQMFIQAFLEQSCRAVNYNGYQRIIP